MAVLLAVTLIAVGVVAEVRFGQVDQRADRRGAGAAVELPRVTELPDVAPLARSVPADELAIVSRGAQRNGTLQLTPPPAAPTAPGGGSGGTGGSGSGSGSVSGSERVVDGCVVVDPAPANRWRADRGLAPLAESMELVRASCAWSKELVRRGRLVHGAQNEVLHMSTRSPGDAFAAWRASSSHFSLLVTSRASTTHIGCARASGVRADGVTAFYTTCRMNW